MVTTMDTIDQLQGSRENCLKAFLMMFAHRRCPIRCKLIKIMCTKVSDQENGLDLESKYNIIHSLSLPFVGEDTYFQGTFRSFYSQNVGSVSFIVVF